MGQLSITKFLEHHERLLESASPWLSNGLFYPFHSVPLPSGHAPCPREDPEVAVHGHRLTELGVLETARRWDQGWLGPDLTDFLRSKCSLCGKYIFRMQEAPSKVLL